MKFSSTRTAADSVGNMIGRATMMIPDDKQLQQELTIALNFGEIQKTIEHWLPYGFTHVPIGPGDSSGGGGNGGGGNGGGSSGGGSSGGLQGVAETIVAFLSGNRSHGIALPVIDRRHRLGNMKAGEVAHYDDQTHQTHITRAGHVRSAPNDKYHRHQVMKQGDQVTGGLIQLADFGGGSQYGQVPWAYDPESGQVRNSYSLHEHHKDELGGYHPTQTRTAFIQGDAIPHDGQGKSNVTHMHQMTKSGHTVGTDGQYASNFKHQTQHGDAYGGIASTTQGSRTVTAQQSITHNSKGQTDTATQITHDGTTNVNNVLNVAQQINTQNITASSGSFGGTMAAHFVADESGKLHTNLRSTSPPTANFSSAGNFLTGGLSVDTLSLSAGSTVAGGSTVTGGTSTDTLNVSGTATVNGALSAHAGASIAGGTTTDTLTVTAGANVTGGTVTDKLALSAANGLVAAGTSSATALQLTARINNVTSVPAGTGVKLPVLTMGEFGCLVINSGGRNLLVYPTSPALIDGGLVSVSIPPNTRVLFICLAATVILTAQLTPLQPNVPPAGTLTLTPSTPIRTP